MSNTWRRFLRRFAITVALMSITWIGYLFFGIFDFESVVASTGLALTYFFLRWVEIEVRRIEARFRRPMPVPVSTMVSNGHSSDPFTY